MIATAQDLPLFLVKPGNAHVDRLVDYLSGLDWVNARQILAHWGVVNTDHNRRWIRALANASEGRVAGGQKGYKLVTEMTNEEYNHWRNWMTHQADEMKRRVVEADRVFYARKPAGARMTDQ